MVQKHRKMVVTEANTTNVKQTNRTWFDAEDDARRMMRGGAHNTKISQQLIKKVVRGRCAEVHTDKKPTRDVQT